MKKQYKQRGQGMTEYIVILGVVVAIAVGILWTKFGPTLNTRVDKIVSMISSGS